MKVLDILLGSGEKIVNAKNLVTVAKQAINQMRAEKSGPACDQDTFATIIDTCQCFAPVIQWISLVILATGAFFKYFTPSSIRGRPALLFPHRRVSVLDGFFFDHRGSAITPPWVGRPTDALIGEAVISVGAVYVT